MKDAMERAIGRLLRRVRAGDRRLTWHDPSVAAAPESLRLTSAAFFDGEPMPTRFAGSGVGENVSPPLEWSGAPPATASFALIVQDPDAPTPRPIVHLLAIGIPSDCAALREGALSPASGARIVFGRGSFGRLGYSGPRPVRGHGAHRYVFQLFALSRPLEVGARAGLAEVLAAMRGVVLARGKLTGLYERD
ncbi:MAG: YbhB/YbcL family Raf kinase inhibitor-like protein [Roseiarcus sp.]